jgi:hypothetical protein
MKATNKAQPKKITPSGITGADMARVEFAPMSEANRIDMLKQVDSLFDLGEIEAAVLKRNKISVGQAAGYFSQIVAAAELGGASWEARLKAACRKGEK